MEVPQGPLRGRTLGAGWHRVGNRQNAFGSCFPTRLSHPHPYSPTVCMQWYDYLHRRVEGIRLPQSVWISTWHGQPLTTFRGSSDQSPH